MHCKFCAETNPDNANFCGRCGKALREAPLTYKPRKGRGGVKAIIILLFILSLAAYLSYLIFEPVSFEYEKASRYLIEEIESLKADTSKGKLIDFQFILAPQEIDGYLNEEFFAKNTSGFKAIHTTLLNSEIEIALSTNFLYMPTLFRIRIRPEKSEGAVMLSTSGMSLGHVPIPSFLRQLLYQRYPYLNLEYLVKLTGTTFEEIKIDKNKVFLKGTLSI